MPVTQTGRAKRWTFIYVTFQVRQPGDLGSFGESSMASRRKRGPVALRHQLWLALPLSDVTMLYPLVQKPRQFVNVPKLDLV